VILNFIVLDKVRLHSEVLLAKCVIAQHPQCLPQNTFVTTQPVAPSASTTNESNYNDTKWRPAIATKKPQKSLKRGKLSHNIIVNIVLEHTLISCIVITWTNFTVFLLDINLTAHKFRGRYLGEKRLPKMLCKKQNVVNDHS